MTSSTRPRSVDEPAEFVEIARVERDLLARLDMLTDNDDLVVVAGMIAAGRIDPSVLDALITGLPGPVVVADLAQYGISGVDFGRFQKLWYHFRVPYARASLAWWHLFCVALGRTDDVIVAIDLLTQWLGALAGAGESAVVSAADLLGFTGRTVVVTDREGDDLAALVTAVRRQTPLIAVVDVATAVRIGRAQGIEVCESGGRTGSDRSPEAPWSLWLGAPVDLRAVPGNARRAWAELPAADRTELFEALEQRVTSIERVRLLLGETLVDNRGMKELLAQCRTTPVADWPADRLALATLAWCWQVGGFVLQELNQSFVSLPALTVFLTRRIREYADQLAYTGPPPAAPDHPLRLAEHLSGLRT
ncbi:MAG TPA: hypothetical protein VEO01_41795, partial [Pseudonocardiaceae bacterium]|nr:hypothetical protein [Pseudonocardiaceae bacterium]